MSLSDVYWATENVANHKLSRLLIMLSLPVMLTRHTSRNQQCRKTYTSAQDQLCSSVVQYADHRLPIILYTESGGRERETRVGSVAERLNRAGSPKNVAVFPPTCLEQPSVTVDELEFGRKINKWVLTPNQP